MSSSSSSSSIPNLLSLRGTTRGGRGSRHRGRGGSSSTRQGPGHDATIQGTDTDAAVSRLSAVDIGFLNDPYAQHFVQGSPGAPVRRLPIINRGTYTRTTALDILVDSFLSGTDEPSSTPSERQIISLGAGTDTRSARLFSQSQFTGVTYHEIDFPVICTRKLNTVKATPLLMRVLPNPVVEENGSWQVRAQNGNQYWCHGIDLRELPHKDGSALMGLKTDVPTLLISECCLCYLETSKAQDVVKWFTDRVPDLGLIIYEPTDPDDSFGKVMISNLGSRGIVMPTLATYKSPTQQEARLKEAGFEHVQKLTVKNIWDTWIPGAEKERVNSLEGLDEVEEWDLLASHYIIAWAWRGRGFKAWHNT